MGVGLSSSGLAIFFAIYTISSAKGFLSLLLTIREINYRKNMGELLFEHFARNPAALITQFPPARKISHHFLESNLQWKMHFGTKWFASYMLDQVPKFNLDMKKEMSFQAYLLAPPRSPTAQKFICLQPAKAAVDNEA